MLTLIKRLWDDEDAFGDRRTGERSPRAQVSVSTGKMERSTGNRFTNRSSSRHISCWLLISRAMKIIWSRTRWTATTDFTSTPMASGLCLDLAHQYLVSVYLWWWCYDRWWWWWSWRWWCHRWWWSTLLQRWRCSSSPTASCPTSPLTGGSTQAIRWQTFLPYVHNHSNLEQKNEKHPQVTLVHAVPCCRAVVVR